MDTIETVYTNYMDSYYSLSITVSFRQSIFVGDCGDSDVGDFMMVAF